MPGREAAPVRARRTRGGLPSPRGRRRGLHGWLLVPVLPAMSQARGAVRPRPPVPTQFSRCESLGAQPDARQPPPTTRCLPHRVPAPAPCSPAQRVVGGKRESRNNVTLGTRFPSTACTRTRSRNESTVTQSAARSKSSQALGLCGLSQTRNATCQGRTVLAREGARPNTPVAW